jgi:hypothetical protein
MTYSKTSKAITIKHVLISDHPKYKSTLKHYSVKLDKGNVFEENETSTL